MLIEIEEYAEYVWYTESVQYAQYAYMHIYTVARYFWLQAGLVEYVGMQYQKGKNGF